MKKGIIYTGLIFMLFAFASCDDFLQKDPPSSPSESIFWKKKSDYEQALTACYSVVYDGQGVFSLTMPCYDNLTDNTLCQYDESTYGRSKTMIQGDILPTTDGFVSNVFGTAYKAISRCNLFITKLNEYEGADITQNEKVYMEAQAKALRGYFYHWLFLCYKEVPVFTEFLSLEEQYQPKVSRQILYERIMTDLTEAANALGDNTYMDTPGRMTKGACLAFMARVTMFHGFSNTEGIPVGTSKAEEMKKVVELCEQIKGYELDENIRTAFVESSQMDSKEMIFSARYGAPDFANDLNLIYCGWSSIMVQRNLVDAFECTDGLPWGESPLTVLVDEELNNSKVSDRDEVAAEREKLFTNRDRRLVQGINAITVFRFPENSDYPNNPVYYDYEPSLSGFGLLRLIQPFGADSYPHKDKTGPDLNVMRFAHVLLMLAEAENEINGPTQKAYNAINAVRERAGQPVLPSNLSKEQFRERVRKEWRYETIFEGWRYFQLKQWDELKNIPATIAKEPFYKVEAKYESRFMFWPIPQGEIDKANGILVQDPAYN